MKARKIAIVAAAGALVAGGAGAAIGATANRGTDAEAEILAEAAKTLNTTPEKLRDALGAAEDSQLDQAVKDGNLTQAQADAIKKHRQQSGRVLGIPPGPLPPFGHGPDLRVAGPGPIAAVAKALGISERELMSRLRDGKTIAEIAKDEGKDLADVTAAVKAAEKQHLDAAVKAGKLTQKQADEILAQVDELIDHLGDRPFGMRFRGGPGFHRGDGGPIADVAKAIGITEHQLIRRLRSGKTIAEIAKDEGKDLGDVKAAVKTAEKQRLDQAVKDGRLTQKQADELYSHIDDLIDHLGERPFGFGLRRPAPPPPGGPPMPMPPPPPGDETP